MVPGNHDVDRSKVDDVANMVQVGLLNKENQNDIASILGDTGQREVLLKRHAAYLGFYGKWLGEAQNLPWWQRPIGVRGQRLHIAGLDSAWMACGDNDRNNLLLGRFQLHQTVVTKEADDADWRIALLHHPLEYLAEYDYVEARRTIHRHCDLLLRGHLHETEIYRVVPPDPARACLELAAGCVYEDSRYPNAFQWIELWSEPKRVRVLFRSWINGAWSVDRNQPGCPDGTAEFDLHIPEGGDRPPIPADPYQYMKDLYDATGHIDIRGLAVSSGKAHSFLIEELYVGLSELNVSLSIDRSATKERQLTDEIRNSSTPHTPKQPRLAVIGDPGAGKSTFLKWIAHTLASDRLGLSNGAGKARFRIEEPLIPVLVRVADWLEHIQVSKAKDDPSRPTTDSSPDWLFHYLGKQAEAGNHGLGAVWFEERLKKGDCLILLDGLDETPDRREREGMVARIQAVAKAFRDCPLVVTSRPAALHGNAILSQFRTVSIGSLEDATIKTFLERWSQALQREDRATATVLRDELLAAINSRPAIKHMARNMVMLTALAVVHWNENRLPEERAELYESILTWLSRSRELRSGRESPERCLVILQELALAMQRDPKGRKVQASRRWAAEKIAAEFGDPRSRTAVEKADAFLEAEEIDSGILVRRDADLWFWHLTFQEYLVARAIAARLYEEQKVVLLGGDKVIYQPEWREVVQLLGGVLHTRQGRAKVDGLFTAVLDDLYAVDDPALTKQARTVGLLDGIVRDLRPSGFEPADTRYRETLGSIMRVFESSTANKVTLKTRLQVADVLGRAGDPRLVPDNPERWVPIPGGSISTDAEACSQNVLVPGFYIARWPTTVADYQCFVVADGYQDAQWWRLGGFVESVASPKKWEEQLKHPSRPVVYVSWYEAQAYCAWLTDELRRKKRSGFRIKDNQAVRLPKSAEWQYAAVGHAARSYPWGNEVPDENRANCGGHLGHPTPVGVFPAGATPKGVLDIVGNVWEWCEDYAQSRRVLRGGAFYHDENFDYCAASIWNLPGACSHAFGFRLVLSPLA